MPRDAFVVHIQRELCHPIWARKVSGLLRNRPLAQVVEAWLALTSANYHKAE